MATHISRSQFLRGDFTGRSSPLRPPWALPESRFVDRCTRCGDCVPACPERILAVGRGGYPHVDFRNGSCRFCADCVRACKAGALRDRGGPAWSYRASIDERCLAARGVECRACGDQCEVAAIRFRLRVGGAARPVLDQSRCTGCGACYAACPVSAIGIRAQ